MDTNSPQKAGRRGSNNYSMIAEHLKQLQRLEKIQDKRYAPDNVRRKSFSYKVICRLQYWTDKQDKWAYQPWHSLIAKYSFWNR